MRSAPLLSDEKGRLWIGTSGGGLTLLENRNFITYTRANGLSSNAITALDRDSEGTLYIGTDGGGLNVFKNGRFHAFKTEDGLPDNAVHSIAHDRNRTIWIGTHTGLAFLRDGRIGVSPIPECRGIHISALATAGNGELWVGTNSAGLFHLDRGKAVHYTKKSGLAADAIWNILVDAKGAVWIGTGGGGLSRLHKGQFETFASGNGLSDNDVISLFADSDGSLWVGTGSGGLNQFRDAMFTTFSTRDGLSSNVVLPVLEDSEGNVWIGTDRGLNRLSNGGITHFTERDGLSDRFILSLCEAWDHSIWAGSKNGLNRIKDGKVTVYRTKDGLPDDAIAALYRGRSGEIWIGTRGGLARFAEGKFTTYTSKDGLSNPFVLAIYEDEHGVVWIGTEGGLNRLEKGHLTAYLHREGLPNDVIRAIGSIDGALWLGTDGGGLVRFDGRKFVTLGVHEGLLSDSVFVLLDDGFGNIWMTSNHGPFRVSKRELSLAASGQISQVHSVPFDVRDGLATKECNGGFQPAGWRGRDGRLWFPTMKGVTMADPRRWSGRPAPGTVYVDSLVADGHTVALPGPLQIAPGQGRLEFTFAGANVLSPERLHYQYMLDGFDREWTDAGTRRSAYYTNIPPGQYQFRVTGCNEDGLCSPVQSTISIQLLPHFYQTSLFGFAVALMVGAVVAAAYWLRIERLRALERKLRRLVDERTLALSESEQKFRQLAENIHEMFWIMDPAKGRFLYVSPACVDICGLAAEEILADPSVYFTRVHPDDLARVKTLSEARKRAVEVGDEYRLRTAAGSTTWVSDRSYPVIDGKQRLLRIVGVIEDITARKRAEELLKQLNNELETRVRERTAELVRTNQALSAENTERRRVEEDLRAAVEAANVANRAKSEFLANMSHEIRTPMNGVLGMTTLALNTELPSEAREHLETSRTSPRKACLRVINDILDISKIDAGRLALESIPFQIRRVVGTSAEDAGASRTPRKGWNWSTTSIPMFRCLSWVIRLVCSRC